MDTNMQQQNVAELFVQWHNWRVTLRSESITFIA